MSNKRKTAKLPPSDFNVLCESLVDCFGTQTKAADKIALAQSSLNACLHDRSRNSMPPISAMLADIETNGRFKAESLCPDLVRMTELARKIAEQRGYC